MISIVIPAYNIEQYIENTLNSIKNNYVKNIEIIIIDDGSNDNTIKVIENFKKDNKDIALNLIAIKNNGVSNARNIGIRNSTKKYILFLDGDDLLEDDSIKKLLLCINEEETELVVGAYKNRKNNFVDERLALCKHETNKESKSNDSFINYLLNNTNIRIGSFIVNKEFLLKNDIWFNQNISYGEDIEFISKVLLNSKKIKYVNFFIMTYIIRENSAINNKFNYRMLEVLKANRNIKEYAQLKSNGINKDINKLLDIEYVNQQRLVANKVIDSFNAFKDIKDNISKYKLMNKDTKMPSILSYINYKKYDSFIKNTLYFNSLYIYWLLRRVGKKRISNNLILD